MNFINMNRNYRNCYSILGFVNSIFTEFMKATEETHPFSIDYTSIDSTRNDEEEKNNEGRAYRAGY